MQFRDIAVTTQSPNSIGEADIKVFDTDQAQESSLRTGCRNNAISFDLLTVMQMDACRKQSVSTPIY